MKRRSATLYRQKNSPAYSKNSISTRLKWIVFLLFILIILIYLNRHVKEFNNENQKSADPENSELTLQSWRLDVEQLFSQYYFPLKWIKGWSDIQKKEINPGEKNRFSVSYPVNFSIHPMVISLIRLCERHHLRMLESYERVSPHQIGLGFSDKKGTYLFFEFEENSNLEWYNGRIAIIIDDFGYTIDNSLDTFLNLPFPITFSIIPGTKYASQVATKAKEAGFNVLIHLPMEPLNSRVENDGYTIFTNMSQKQVDAVVGKSIKIVPGAIGVNNHMGSKATADRPTMNRLMRSLKKQNLIFIDSVTSRRSVAYSTAQKMGIPSLKMDTYLDNPKSSKSVREKLKEVIQKTGEHHTALIIGHDREETGRILTEELVRWAYKGIHFVRLNELLENP